MDKLFSGAQFRSLLLEIFSHLSSWDLGSLAQVNKFLNSFILSKEVWLKITQRNLLTQQFVIRPKFIWEVTHPVFEYARDL